MSTHQPTTSLPPSLRRLSPDRLCAYEAMRAGLATLRGLGVRSLRVFDDGSLVDAMRRLQVGLGAGERARGRACAFALTCDS